jgi:hypothetical protein
LAETEWWGYWDDDPDDPWCWFLKVDEDSSPDELEAEIEYWMDQIRTYQIDGWAKKSLMAAIRWMTMLLAK